MLIMDDIPTPKQKGVAIGGVVIAIIVTIYSLQNAGII